jgi:CheY-like chemotaxis protein
MASQRILVVGTDKVWALGVQSTLGAFGYEIDVANSGLAALEAAAEQRPDLVICDAAMDGMDGCTLIRHLRESPELGAVPAFIVFDSDTAELRMEAFQAGADHCISRPVKWDELRVRISRIFDAHTRVLARASSPAFGPPIRRRSTMGFGGKIAKMGLPSVLTLLEMEQRSGELLLMDDARELRGRIRFRKGHVIGSETAGDDASLDAEAVFELLNATDGRFEFREGAETGEARVSLRVQELLLEHARRSDEAGKA